MSGTPIIKGDAHAVYRLFDDQGRLLYVGATVGISGRLRTHFLKSWGDDIATITIEKHATRDGARAAEALAIVAEKPLYNIYYTGRGHRRDPGQSMAEMLLLLAALGPSTQTEVEHELRRRGYNNFRSSGAGVLHRLVREGRVDVVGQRPSNSGRWKTARVFAVAGTSEVAA